MRRDDKALPDQQVFPTESRQRCQRLMNAEKMGSAQRETLPDAIAKDGLDVECGFFSMHNGKLLKSLKTGNMRHDLFS